MLCTLQHCFKKNKSRKRRVKRVAKVWKCRLNRHFGDFSPRNYQSSRRRRRCRRKVYGSHTDWFDYSDFIIFFCDFTEKLSILSQIAQKGIWVSLRLIWLSRFYYFLLRFPRFLRETINPLADGAERGSITSAEGAWPCLTAGKPTRAQPAERWLQ